MVHKSSPIGNEITCVMQGIAREVLLDNEKLKQILKQGLLENNFTILKEISHEFSPQGYTLVFLIAESEASIHTYPEHNSLVLHIYSCRNSEDGRNALNCIKEKLSPERIQLDERKVIVGGDN